MPCAPAAEAIRCRRPLAASNSPSAPRVSSGAATTRLFTSSHSTTCAAPPIAAIYRADLAAVELERDVVMSLRPDRRGTGQNGICDRDHRRQRLIVNGDSFRGIACFPGALRDHEGYRLADIAHDVARQRVTGRDHERRGHRDTGHRARQRANIVGSQFRPREHGRDALHLTRRIDADRGNARMRMRRTNDDAMKRVWRREIGDVAPAPLHEALVFKAVEAAPQQWLGHVKMYEARRLQRQQQGRQPARRGEHASARVRLAASTHQAYATSACTRCFSSVTRASRSTICGSSCCGSLYSFVRDETDDPTVTGCITVSTAYLPISRPISVPTRVEKR